MEVTDVYQDSEKYQIVQMEIKKIIKDLIDVDVKSRNDKVMSILANSITIMKFIFSINERFNIDISINELIKVDTLDNVTTLICKKLCIKNEEVVSSKGIESNISKQKFPLTEMQKAYLSGRDKELELGGTSTNFYVEIKTKLDIKRLNYSLNYLISKQQMLRTIILGEEQFELDNVEEYIIKTVDLTNFSKEEKDNYLIEERKINSNKIFSVDKWPLFQIKAYKVEEDEYLLTINFDMLIMDGASIYIFVKQLITIYEKGTENFKKIDFTFKDYIFRYQKLKQTIQYKNSRDYWMNKIDDIYPSPKLPLTNKLKNIKNLTYKRKTKSIPEITWNNFCRICKKSDITPSALLCSIYAKVLAFWSNSRQFSINATVFNRIPFDKKIDRVIGDFTSSIILSCDLSEDGSTIAEGKKIQRTIYEALDKRLFDGVEVIREIKKKNRLSVEALMPVVFTSMLFDEEENYISKLGKIEWGISHTPQVYIDNQITKIGNEAIITWDYVEDVFEKDVINGMFNQFVNAIISLADGQECKFNLSKNEKSKIELYNNTSDSIKYNTLNGLFEQQVCKFKNKIAISDEKAIITYGELDEKSNQVAHFLKSKGIVKGDFITLIAKKNIDTVICILGILKVGAVYVPIDSKFPESRKKHIIKNSNSKFTLSGESLLENNISEYSKAKLENRTNIEDLAYVIYTSGSTGNPKGVMITHKAAVNTILCINKKFSINNNDRFIGLSSICFDLSVYDIFGSLSVGAELIFVEESTEIDKIISILKEKKITVWNSVPALMDKTIKEMENDLKIDSLKLILLSGDWIPVSLPEKIKKHFINSNVISLGGATEAGIWSIYYKIDEVKDNWSKIPYGRPLANQKVYILNNCMQLCPIGVEGEIYIGGEGLAKGYLNDEEKTKLAFVYNEELGKLYKTGDYGVFKKENYIEFLGRKDTQIKVRGYRIELGEIQSALLKYNNIKNAVASVYTDEKKEQYICGFIEASEVINIRSLKKYLVGILPEYMVPSRIIQIDEIPLNNNGKIDRNKLPQLKLEKKEYKNNIKPRNEVEEKILNIWKDIFNIKEISIKDDFFELGGDSLKAQQIIVKIREVFNVKISIKDLLVETTIENIAEIINAKLKGNNLQKIDYRGDIENIIKDNENKILKNKTDLYNPFKLNSVQYAYFVGRNKNFELGNTSEHYYLEIETKLDIKRLNLSFQKVILKHPMMRAIILDNGTQKILKNVPEYNIDIEDISLLSEEDQNKQIIKYRKSLSHEIFDVSKWPLFNIKALKLSNDKSYLFFSLDLLIADGASQQIIINDLLNFYNNESLQLSEIGYSFKQYVEDLDKLKKSNYYISSREYWLGKLDEFQFENNLPLKSSLYSIDHPIMNRKSIIIDKDKWDKIKEIAKSKKVTQSALLCSIYAMIIGLWSNKESVTVNLTTFNRYPFNKEVNDIVGDFTNLMLVNIKLEKNNNIWTTSKKLQNILAEGMEYRIYDGVELVENLAKKNHLVGKAIAPIVFTSMLFDYNNKKQYDMSSLGKIKWGVSQTPQVYLDNQIMELNGSLYISWDYVEDLFEDNVISRMFQQYVNLILGVLGNQEDEVTVDKADLSIIDEYNNTSKHIKCEPLHKIFSQQVYKFKSKPAITANNVSISYLELNKKSNQVANFLRYKGIGRNDLVAVYTRKNIETVINILGVLKSGGAYVPIEESYPDKRKQYICDSSKCSMILKSESFDDDNISRFDDCDVENVNTINDLAYIIYTSGTTGKPKGVSITHGAVVNTILDINDKFNINHDDKLLGLSSFCFDLSVYDIFGAITSGAELVLIEDQRDAKQIIKTIDEKKITIWNSVPSTMQIVLTMAEQGYKNTDIKLIMLSGDWIPLNLVSQIKEHFINSKIISLGGATEASIWSIYYNIDDIRNDWKSIPYGMPLSNQQIYILNYKMDQCPIGVEGEIYIGGKGVANGYLNDQEKTKKAFIEHYKYGKLYKTGDRGVFRKDGYVEFLGRKDTQVKIRGYRVELGEIESNLLKNNSISGAFVTNYRKNIENCICAYIVVNSPISNIELKEFLLKSLPDYMIPKYFIRIDSIPLNINGKVNKKALPVPEYDNTEVVYMKPENEVEKKLVEIWEDILGVKDIGVNRNFFELGGDSILVAKLMRKIIDNFNVDIPLSKIFGISDIRELAKEIMKCKSKCKNNKNIILIRQGEKQENNIFFIHGGEGTVKPYLQLGQNIDKKFNIWGIRTNLNQGISPRNISINELAKQYIVAIKSIQNEGPYTIGGWSLGGTIAYEVIRQLESMGNKVNLLIMIETKTIKNNVNIPLFSVESERKIINKYFSNMDEKALINGHNNFDIDLLWKNVLSQGEKNKNFVFQIKNKIPNEVAMVIPDVNMDDPSEFLYYTNLLRSYSNAADRYKPQNSIDSSIYYFYADNNDISNFNEWSNYTNDVVKYFKIEGNHVSILNNENSFKIAQIINRKLQEII